MGQCDLAQVARDGALCALRAGAEQVVASASEMAGIRMRARGRKFESAVREGAQTVTIRVFNRGRTGVATTSALSRAAIDMAAARAVALALEVEPDIDAAPADDVWLARTAPEVPMYAPSALAAHDLGVIALEIEAAAMSGGDAAVRVGEAGASSVDGSGAIAIGRDFARSTLVSRHDIWCNVIAERDGTMAQDRWSSSDRRLSHLLSPEAVGKVAAARASRKLGGRPLDTRSCPVLLDAVVAASLVNEVAAALTGRAQFQGATFLRNGLGEQAMADHLDLIEDPFEPFGLSSGVCDSEGVGSLPRSVISRGRVEGFFLSSLYARKLGMVPTGNADGIRNLRFTSRHPAEPIEAMLRKLDRGLWVTEMIGGAVDPVSGAYSKAAAGFWVEDGEIAFPVQDITIAGSLPEMLRGIVALGSDVHRSEAIRTGSVLIERMRISGR